jgi:SPOR domain/SdrD B-like domain
MPTSAASLSPRRACGMLAVLLAAAPAAAQQGSLQVSAAAQGTTGGPRLGVSANQLEPDLGVSWLQPGTRVGTMQLEVRGVERKNDMRLGRVYGALRDLKYGGFKWTVEAGDAYYAPTIGDYRFSNLVTPAVTFVGAAVGARSARTDVGLVAGKGTVWRNIFGSDPDTFEQTIVAGRAAHRASDRLDLNARGSRTRTGDLEEFTYSIAANDQVGGGARYALSSSLQVIADGSAVWYRRAGSTINERDGSGLVGLHWLHSRGWLQVNASRFSPGESPTLNSPLPDRAGQFAAGEFDLLSRMRVFGGWETFRSNLDPSAALLAGQTLPRNSGSRQFGGVRAQVGARSTLTLRAESGDRISKYVTGRHDVESDTGVLSADWHTGLNRVNGFLRVAQRSDVNSASRSGSYTQQDVFGQVFLRLTPSTQLFGMSTATRTTDDAGGGSTYWQAGGGAQLQVIRQGLWMRTEGTISRNTDLLTQLYLPRESFSLGFNGFVTPRTSVGIDVYLDHAPFANSSVSPWATRSIVRVIRTLPTGAPFAAGAPGLFRTVPKRAIATVKGSVFVDWNANGLQDAGEHPVEEIPLSLGSVGATRSGKNGEFVFRNVPDGLHDVGLDLGALPIDFEAPPIARLQVALSGDDTRQVLFGLIPLGSIRGRVVRDMNSNGTADSTEPAIEGAVVVLDGGRRSERAKRGQYAFEAVQSGEHTVTLLADSLPEGALIAGEATQVATLGRESMAVDVPFVVSLEARAEIRKVFPGSTAAPLPKPGAPARRVGRPAPVAPKADAALARPDALPATGATPAATPGTFALQVGAFDDPLRARQLVADLKEKGLSAYLVEPSPDAPNAPYRVRVGAFASRLDAERAAASVGRAVGNRVWITQSTVGSR